MFHDVEKAAEDLTVALDALLRALSDAQDDEDCSPDQAVECGDLWGILHAVEQDWMRVAERVERLSR